MKNRTRALPLSRHSFDNEARGPHNEALILPPAERESYHPHFFLRPVMATRTSLARLPVTAVVLLVLTTLGCGTRGTEKGFIPGPARVDGLVLAPDGTWLGIGQGKSVTVWDLAKGERRARMPELAGGVKCVALSRDGKWLAAGSADQTLKLFDAAAAKEQLNFAGHTGMLTALTFSADGKVLIAAAGDPNPYHFIVELKLWDTATGKHLADLPGLKSPVYSLALSPDGKTLVTGSYDHTVKVWDVATRKERAGFDGEVGIVTAVAFSPDGGLLALGGSVKGIRLLNTADWKEKARLPGHGERLTGLAFSPSGKALASCSEDKTAKLWDVATAKEKATLEGHTSHVFCLAYGKDDRTLFTGGRDGTVRVWDTAEGKEQKTIRAEPPPS
jgi:WD40 repeat protein